MKIEICGNTAWAIIAVAILFMATATIGTALYFSNKQVEAAFVNGYEQQYDAGLRTVIWVKKHN